MSQVDTRSDVKVASVSVRDIARSMKRSLNAVLDRWRYRALVNRQTFPRPVRAILVVCKGNICRSPLAEAYLKYQVEKHGLPIAVQSAGLETSFGKPAHPFAQVVGTRRGCQEAQQGKQCQASEKVKVERHVDTPSG